ncbi:MAG: exonuclease [Symploca sp. SIO3E6]|nr:exonuclease [Caldora sp. SIO3E6]
MLPIDFIVIDTEGQELLREIAVVDYTGKQIYEAFVEGAVGNEEQYYNLKSLEQILQKFKAIAEGKKIVCHCAQHDKKVLQRSYDLFQEVLPRCDWVCTYKLARMTWPHLESYSLGNLCTYLNLRVNQQYFSEEQAHLARYDALFTYQLYLQMTQQDIKQLLQEYPNPFASSRVDNPFQLHPDLKTISQQPYQALKSILQEIKDDGNHQSKGLVITGEAGTGKSHLMMRLAQERLARNRLFFINHPNDPDGILFHIYSRVLESLIQRVGSTNYTQLDHLLAYFLSKIINRQHIPLPTQKEEKILKVLEANPLDIYEALGSAGTERKREFWKLIETKVEQWWQFTYDCSGFSWQILKGIIRYCYYTDPKRKLLIKRWLAGFELETVELEKLGLIEVRWDTQTNRETLGLEAISVISKLSLVDEPLIMVFDQLESLALEQNRNLLLAFGSSIKELFTHIKHSLIISIMFPDSWEVFQTKLNPSITDRQGQFQLTIQSPNKQSLEDLLNLHLQDLPASLNEIFTPEEQEDILHQGVIRKVINRATDYYRFKRDGIPVPQLQPTAQHPTSRQTILEISSALLKISQSVEELSKKLNSLLVQEPTLVPNSVPGLRVGTAKGAPHFVVQPTLVNWESQTLLDYLKGQKNYLEQEYRESHHLKIITPSQDRGKLQTVLSTCRQIYGFDIDHLKLGKKKVPENLVLIKDNQRCCITFIYEGSSTFTSRIKNLNLLVVGNLNTSFYLLRDLESPVISGKVGQIEIKKFEYCKSTTYVDFDLEHRVALELFEQMIIDIQNRDLEVDLNLALTEIANFMPNSWIIRLLKGEKPF